MSRASFRGGTAKTRRRYATKLELQPGDLGMGGQVHLCIDGDDALQLQRGCRRAGLGL